MYFVYVIENLKKNWYIGFTNNLKKRLKQHNNNETYTTKRLGGPWRIIYMEGSLQKYDAQKRERFLKTSHGREYLQKRLKNYLSNN